MKGRPCTICQHPKRKEIDLAIAGEKSTILDIAARYCVSRHAIARHKQQGHVLRVPDNEKALEVLHALTAELAAAIMEARQSQDVRIKRGAIRQAQEVAATVLRCTTI
ncbi:hypothetical protein Metfor_1377 [Methanoregula formicica SMSP]|uniref:Uncharacterized protein n=1 Tax=Methanoregula formicica (strain DSM 22288 / NBRC 105244 / SMSP) TaxID=593750 RepID=L0HF45_METFS|nr:hypothetical protein Metfor_1377 [Methanoregula formicica SMSP]